VIHKESPALSRNCKEFIPSQDARQFGSNHSLVDGTWKMLLKQISNPCPMAGFFYPLLAEAGKNLFRCRGKMKKSLWISLIVMLMAASLLPGCQPKPVNSDQPAKATPINITDGLGRSISIDNPAQRIISLSPPLTEMLFAVGAGGQMAGRDSYSDYPADVKNITDVGWTYGKYNLETVVNLKPDLVLAGEITTPELVASLENLGIQVFYLKNPLNLDEMYVMLKTIGELSGHSPEADELVNNLQQRAADLQTKLDKVASRPTVFYELDATDPSKPYTPGPGTLYTKLISMAGGENIGARLSTSWAQISLEQLLVNDPTYILLGDAGFGTTVEMVGQRAGWQSMTAVKEGRVLPFDDNLLVRYGPRLLDGLEALARMLHPEVFK
jgi:iron complex transport system substrate-binding protein